MAYKTPAPILVNRGLIGAPISTEKRDFASFSDDTHTDGRLTGGYRASITAQVLPDARIDWYFELQPYFVFESGEIKSDAVLERFQTLPVEVRRRVRGGLAHVRVHIFDARPFALEISDIYRDVYGAPLPFQMLRQLGRSGGNAERFSARHILSVANSYIRDRASGLYLSEQLIDHLDHPGLARRRRLQCARPGSPSSQDSAPRGLGREFVGVQEVDQALAIGSVSAAVFTDAVETARTDFDRDETGLPFDSDWGRRARVGQALSRPHAVDEGNSRVLATVEQQRRAALDAVSSPFGVEPGLEVDDRVASMPSTSSIFIQAADIAGGFARRDFELGGLPQVVRNFRHVSYNGKRATENNVGERLGRARIYVVE